MTPERLQQVEGVYHAALEREAGARAAFLQQACKGDAGLLRQVELLLTAGEKTAGLLDSPVLEAAAKMFDGDRSQSLIGQSLGSYHVFSLLGTGGMGEVYLAKDTKLRRDVALKVLPRALAQDPERLARFRREAQLLASLNHPNIAAIYGFEEVVGVPFLVLELVEGETLAERIKRAGAFPAEEALKISQQIAEALEYAHKKAITHRDIKPANIKVTPEGQVKVLDFGLAKVVSEGEAGLSQLPTLSGAMTEPGRILGTPAYMSPEQAQSKAVDKQTDIWSFGCVLYELLTGQRAFGGDNISQTLVAVLRGEPDWRALPATTPPMIQRLMRRCLQKDVARRFRDAGDVAIEIEEAVTTPALTPSESVPEGSSSTRKQTRGRLGWVVAGVAALAFLVTLIGMFVSFRGAPAEQTAVQFSILPPENTSFPGTLNSLFPAISPDGTRVAFLAALGGRTYLWVRTLDSLEAQMIPGTEGAYGPFWSPDGRYIAFGSGQKLQRVDLSGGPPQTLAEMGPGFSGRGSWNRDGTILHSMFGRLFRIPASGGELTPVTELDALRGDLAHRNPHFLPDGRHFLYLIDSRTPQNRGIYLSSLDSKESIRLLPADSQAEYSQGHLVFVRDGTLMAQPFDADQLQITGDPVPITQQVSYDPVSGRAAYAVSEQDVLVYRTASEGVRTQFSWVDRRGQLSVLRTPPRVYGIFRLSSEGSKLAVEVNAHIWVFDIARELLTRVTFEGANSTPVWTPDGTRIAYWSGRGGFQNLYWKPADGSGSEERLTDSEYPHAPSSFSPDGRFLAYREIHPQTGRDIWILPLEGDRKPFPFLRTPFNESGAKFSPDGRWLAYVSNESGRNEVYVQPFTGPGTKRQVSIDGGEEIVWARNAELFYRSDDRMMVVATNTQGTFSYGPPRLLFETTQFMPSGGGAQSYDVTPDGQRILWNMASEGAASPLTVVLNWTAGLKK